MEQGEGRWVLAFDASCGGCREISHTVGQACDGETGGTAAGAPRGAAMA